MRPSNITGAAKKPQKTAKATKGAATKRKATQTPALRTDLDFIGESGLPAQVGKVTRRRG